MIAKLKRKILWSALGGLAAGTAFALLRRTRKARTLPLAYEKIPPECKRIIVMTERFEIEEEGRPCVAHDSYTLQTTSFRVWNVLDLTSSVPRPEQRGNPIYHATIVRHVEAGESGTRSGSTKTPERFYGTVAVADPEGKMPGPNCLARGGILQMPKCLVGGASNGIETGDVHRSAGVILNYRFEYGAPPAN